PNTTYNNRHLVGAGITFIYGGPAGLGPLDRYNGHIVQYDGDQKQQKTSWLVTNGHRNWIPTAALFNCLRSNGAPPPDVLSSTILDQLPDQTGMWVLNCSGGTGVGTGATPPPPTTTATTTPLPPPPPTTTSE